MEGGKERERERERERDRERERENGKRQYCIKGTGKTNQYPRHRMIGI